MLELMTTGAFTSPWSTWTGGSLEDEFSGGVVDVSTALNLIADACRGAEFAHMNGYIHRDIKPANIMMSEEERAKLSDFGLAPRVGPDQRASPYGYVAHCAPEVIRGSQTSPQTDVYALGVTLYRLLNGDAFLPDPATITGDLDDAIIAGSFPNRSRFRDHIPEGVRRLVRKSIHVDPQKRTPSATALRHAIERDQPPVSFTEEASEDVAYWTGEDDRRKWEAEIWKNDNGGFSFQIQRSGESGKPRRVVADCRDFPSEAQARRHARAVLDGVSRQGA
jgi:serine/threonine-protein kinase